MQILSEIQSQTPPGRFLMPSNNTSKPSAAAGASSTPTTGNADDGEDSSDVHPALRAKEWVLVDRNRAYQKVLHRLREREKEKGDTSSSSDDDVPAAADTSDSNAAVKTDVDEFSHSTEKGASQKYQRISRTLDDMNKPIKKRRVHPTTDDDSSRRR